MKKFEVRMYISEAQYYLLAEIADEYGMNINEYVKYLIAHRIETFYKPESKLESSTNRIATLSDTSSDALSTAASATSATTPAIMYSVKEDELEE